MRKILRTAIASAFFLTALGTAVQAENLKVFVGGAMTEPLRDVAADFTKRTGNAVDIVRDTTGALQKRLRAGDRADLVIVTSMAVESLTKEKLLEEAHADLARALIGVGIHKGAKAPDISTPEKFKAALLGAKSIVYVDPKAGGTSGIYFEGLLKKLGIADAIKPKTVYRFQGSQVADAVAKGDAELGITFGAEMLPNKDVNVFGDLPASIQLPTIYVGAVTSHSANAAAAHELLKAMQTPSAKAAMTKARLEPLVKP